MRKKNGSPVILFKQNVKGPVGAGLCGKPAKGFSQKDAVNSCGFGGGKRLRLNKASNMNRLEFSKQD